jgi:glycerophosphoryl diester phosphodiesterase
LSLSVIRCCVCRFRQVTKDGTPVVWHDNTVLFRDEHGAQQSAAISDLTLTQFKRLTAERRDASPADAGDGRSGAALLRVFKDERGARIEKPTEWRCILDDVLPTLEEVFERVRCLGHR